MNVDDMTVNQLKDIAKQYEADKARKRKGERFCGVLLTSGFVYVGWAKITKSWIYIRDAKNVRYWAGNGLGPSLLNGPKAGSQIDKCGNVKAAKLALHHIVDANPEAWK